MNIVHTVIKKIAPHMKSRGFVLSGKNFYFISNDIAFCVTLEAPGGILYVTAYIMPLYIPCQNRYYTYGTRLNAACSLPLLQKKDDAETITRWCDMLCKCIDSKIIPYYRKIENPNKLIEHIEHRGDHSLIVPAVPPVFMERLKMYTYLYLGNYSRLNTAKICYHGLLSESVFLIDAVRQMYFDEISKIDMLVRESNQGISDFCIEIMNNTRKILQ